MKNAADQVKNKEPPGSLTSWLQLLRISALPTAVSNILVGYLISNGSWQPFQQLILLVLSSGSLYMSGMVLNDWFDAEQDGHLRSSRPIPSGRISVRTAFGCYLVLTLAGMIMASLVSTSSLICAVGLVIAIVLYDCVLKRTSLAPVVMGLCRGLNILLGASYGVVAETDPIPGFPWSTIWIAVSLGIFIAGLTWFARKEATGSNRRDLLAATAVMLVGIAWYVLAPIIFEIAASDGALKRYIAIIVLISLPVLIRNFAAINEASPTRVGIAISTALCSLILYDAALGYLFSQCQVIYPLVILLLLVPSLFLSRWISPT